MTEDNQKERVTDYCLNEADLINLLAIVNDSVFKGVNAEVVSTLKMKLSNLIKIKKLAGKSTEE